MHSLQHVNKVLILGFGREGRSSYMYLKSHYPAIEIGIADQRNVSQDEIFEGTTLTVHHGDNYLEQINDYDLVLKSPGISLAADFVAALTAVISSQIDLFLQTFHNKTIGITGTKGKSTTAALVYHLLKKSGKKALLAGNIGVPVFDVIEKIEAETTVVLELSCHQLQYIQRSPHIAILLNIFPEHLDYYKDFTAYKQAKLNVFKYQDDDDIAIMPEVENLPFSGPARSIPYRINSRGEDVTIQYDDFAGKEQLLYFDRKQITLPGEHNLSNIGAACLAAVMSVSLSNKDLAKALYSFSGLKHRLEFVGEFNKVTFYNDSISTIPETTIAALRCFQNKVDSLILGGFNRGVDYLKLVEEINMSDIENLCLMPETGMIVYNGLLAAGFCDHDGWLICGDRNIRVIFEDDMERLVANVFNVTAKGGICLLSPAAASYNQFKNFEERGEVFVAAVKKMGKRLTVNGK